MQNEAERRKHTRRIVDLAASFAVLIPEETFQPVVQEAVVVDLSEKGAMISVQLDDRTYSQLLQSTRFCRLSVKDEERLPEKIFGKAVWIQPEGTADARSFKIGLFFEDTPDHALSRIREYLNFISTLEQPAS